MDRFRRTLVDAPDPRRRVRRAVVVVAAVEPPPSRALPIGVACALAALLGALLSIA